MIKIDLYKTDKTLLRAGSISLLIFTELTPMTISTPISLATSKGTGSIRPPSTSILFSNLNGIHIPGSVMEAATALEILPWSITTFSPVTRSVALCTES